MNVNEITSQINDQKCNEFITAMEVWDTRYTSFKAIEDEYYKGYILDEDYINSFKALCGIRENAATACMECFPLITDVVDARRAICDHASDLVMAAIGESSDRPYSAKWVVSDDFNYAVVDYYDVEDVVSKWFNVDYPGVKDSIHDLAKSFLGGFDNYACEYLDISAERYYPVRFANC